MNLWIKNRFSYTGRKTFTLFAKIRIYYIYKTIMTTVISK